MVLRTHVPSTLCTVPILIVLVAGCNLGNVAGEGALTDASAIVESLGVTIEGGDHHEAPPLLVHETIDASGAQREFRETFEFANSSEAAVTVTLRNVSCTCFKVLVGVKAIKRGDRFCIDAQDRAKVTFCYRPDRAPRDYSYHAEFAVKRLDGALQRVLVQWNVKVIADVEVNPPAVCHRFGKSDDDAVDRNLHIRRVTRTSGSAPCRMEFLDMPPEVEVLEAHERDSRLLGGHRAGRQDFWVQEWEAQVRLHCTDDVGTDARNQAFRIGFCQPDGLMAATHSVPVAMRRGYGIEHPTVVSFGVVAPGASRTKRILLAAADGERFRVTAVKSESLSFDISFADGGKETRQWLDCTFHAGTDSCSLINKGEIQIQTTHPDARTITLRAIARVAAPREAASGGGG